ncbi:hypothetical protein CTI12_AA146020 [Artemisia annua]|uniref:Uncharacterized protein n=1 Tax=Artemisia annua TaxID=35608 RepID=A0A2U1PJD5_ARTAN|nr:hypothetical protein CTI12_AA146020 [Artemisia annua]
MVKIFHLSRWLWGAKHQHSKITADPAKNGGRLSAEIELDSFDWSIGWLEPHGAGFQSHDDSFAVLVRCYGREHDTRLKNDR